MKKDYNFEDDGVGYQLFKGLFSKYMEAGIDVSARDVVLALTQYYDFITKSINARQGTDFIVDRIFELERNAQKERDNGKRNGSRG